MSNLLFHPSLKSLLTSLRQDPNLKLKSLQFSCEFGISVGGLGLWAFWVMLPILNGLSNPALLNVQISYISYVTQLTALEVVGMLGFFGLSTYFSHKVYLALKSLLGLEWVK